MNTHAFSFIIKARDMRLVEPSVLFCTGIPSYIQEHRVSQAHVPVLDVDQTTCLHYTLHTCRLPSQHLPAVELA